VLGFSRIVDIQGLCKSPLGKLNVWFGKTCVLGPLQEECWGPIIIYVALTAVPPCQSVFPGFGKVCFLPYLKKIRQKTKQSVNFRKVLLASVFWRDILGINCTLYDLKVHKVSPQEEHFF